MRSHRIVAATLAIVGCGQILGVNGGYPAAPQCGGYEFSKDSTCGECMSDKCCAPLEACHADRTCDTWEACVSGCAADDWACHGACGRALSRSNRAIGGVLACKLTQCTDACAQPDLGALLGGASCAECAATKCETETKAFGQYESTDGGTKSSSSTVACFCETNSPFEPDPASVLSCGALWTAPGFAAAQQWAICLGLVCPVDCDLGRFRSCARNYDYPLPQTSVAAHVTAVVLDYNVLSLGAPYPYASVKACDRTDLDCEHPLGTGKTDKDGHVAFDLEIPGNGFDGYFDVTTEGGTSYLSVLSYKISGDMSVVLEGPPAPSNANPVTSTVPGTGTIVVRALDCMGANVQNGTVTASGGTVLSRDAAGNYVPGETASGLTWVFVRDAPEGLITLTASKDGETFAEETVPVRAGVSTSVFLLPLTQR